MALVRPGSEAVTIDGRATRLVREVCGLAGRRQLIAEVRRNLGRAGVLEAVRAHDTAALFDWMSRGMAYQGISDYVADAYMQEHGTVTWHEIQQSLTSPPHCHKLTSYWAFHRCGYNKTNCTCNEPQNLADCPLPLPTLRNGRPRTADSINAPLQEPAENYSTLLSGDVTHIERLID